MDFESLASEYFDGTLSAGDARALLEILRRDPEKRRWFLEMYQQSRLLSVELGPSNAEELAEKVLRELQGDTGQFVNSVLRTVQTPPPVAAPSRRRGPGSKGPAPRRSWAIWAAIAGAAAVVLFGLLRSDFFTAPPDETPVQVRVERVTGQVTVAEGGHPGRAARVGEVMGPGGTLETLGAGSSAVLSYPDKTRLEIAADTALDFRREESGGPGKSLLLRAGRLDAEVSRQPSDRPFLIRSRWAEAKVVGTKFQFSADRESARLEVGEGRVRFTRLEDSRLPRGPGVDVGPGEKAVATSSDLVRWTPVCDLDFSKMKVLPSEMEGVFCPSRILHTPERKIEPALDRIRFERGGLFFDPAPGVNREHGLVVARWKEEIGEDVILEADVAGGALWSLGFALSGDSFEGYRVIFGIRQDPGGIMIDTISPLEFTPLASDPRPIAYEKDHLLRAEKRGQRIQVWVDRELRIDAVIARPLSEGRRRTFALSNFGESPVVRGLRVWRGSGR